MKNQSKQIAFTILRITMGVNIFAHGLIRLPKLDGFSTWMASQFKNTFLPEWLIYSWGFTLPILEFAIGLCLIIGLFTFESSIIGALIMVALIFGSCIAENWEWAGGQMLYSLFYFFIIYYVNENSWAVDNIINKKNK